VLIDELAAEYGWSKATILDTVYLEEIPEYRQGIRRRQAEKRMSELEIALAPHSKPEYQRDLLNRYKQQLVSSSPEGQGPQMDDKLDRKGLQRLRGLVGGKGKAGN